MIPLNIVNSSYVCIKADFFFQHSRRQVGALMWHYGECKIQFKIQLEAHHSPTHPLHAAFQSSSA